MWETGACKEAKADLRPRIAAHLDEAQQRLAELTNFTASLHSALDHLDALPNRDEPCDPQCGFLTGPRPTGPTDGAITFNRHSSEPETGQWRTAPVACSLSGNGMTTLTANWRPVLGGATRAPFSGGLRVTLPAERISQVTELAVARRANLRELLVGEPMLDLLNEQSEVLHPRAANEGPLLRPNAQTAA